MRFPFRLVWRRAEGTGRTVPSAAIGTILASACALSTATAKHRARAKGTRRLRSGPRWTKRSPGAAVKVLACRETENTLPLGLIAKTFGDDHQYRGKLERLKQFEDGAPFGAYREHCDFKNGTTLRWAFRLKEEESRRFWLGPEATATRTPSVKAECLREEACPRPKEGPEKQNCACEIAPVLGGELLAKCLQVAENTPDRVLHGLLCPKTRPYWQTIGRAVFSWACGTRETRV